MLCQLCGTNRLYDRTEMSASQHLTYEFHHLLVRNNVIVVVVDGACKTKFSYPIFSPCQSKVATIVGLSKCHILPTGIIVYKFVIIMYTADNITYMTLKNNRSIDLHAHTIFTTYSFNKSNFLQQQLSYIWLRNGPETYRALTLNFKRNSVLKST